MYIKITQNYIPHCILDSRIIITARRVPAIPSSPEVASPLDRKHLQVCLMTSKLLSIVHRDARAIGESAKELCANMTFVLPLS